MFKKYKSEFNPICISKDNVVYNHLESLKIVETDIINTARMVAEDNDNVKNLQDLVNFIDNLDEEEIDNMSNRDDIDIPNMSHEDQLVAFMCKDSFIGDLVLSDFRDSEWIHSFVIALSNIFSFQMNDDFYDNANFTNFVYISLHMVYNGSYDIIGMDDELSSLGIQDVFDFRSFLVSNIFFNSEKCEIVVPVESSYHSVYYSKIQSSNILVLVAELNVPDSEEYLCALDDVLSCFYDVFRNIQSN